MIFQILDSHLRDKKPEFKLSPDILRARDLNHDLPPPHTRMLLVIRKNIKQGKIAFSQAGRRLGFQTFASKFENIFKVTRSPN